MAANHAYGLSIYDLFVFPNYKPRSSKESQKKPIYGERHVLTPLCSPCGPWFIFFFFLRFIHFHCVYI